MTAVHNKPPQGQRHSMDQHSNKTQTLYSNEKSSHKVLMVIGALFFLISSPTIFIIPGEVKQGNYGVFAALIIPLIGIALMRASWKIRENFLFFGPTPLTPSPSIGQVGGQIGGSITIEKPWQDRDINVTLSCIHSYQTGSGDNRRSHSDILWQEHDKPLYRANGNSSLIEFAFDIPASCATNSTHNGNGDILWKATVNGIIDGKKFNRSWTLPVEKGTGLSSIVIPNAQKEANHAAKLKQAEASIEQQIKTEKTTTGMDILSDQGRNNSMSGALILFGSIFSSAGGFLFYQSIKAGDVPLILPPVFSFAGLSILLFGLFLLGRKLECKIIGDQVHTRRSFFGRQIYTRQGQLTSPEQVFLKSTMSSKTNGIRTEYMALYARVNVKDPNGSRQKDLKVVEGIEGRAAGEAMKRKLIEYLQRDIKKELDLELGS